jgi:hypothetical protein
MYYLPKLSAQKIILPNVLAFCAFKQQYSWFCSFFIHDHVGILPGEYLF